MPQINILSAHVADLIAAGEVVEKPANAVKELLENAFDAHARSVTVDIRGGGRECIRISDDGAGMSSEDAGICCLRHATSKLADEKGLEAIGTMGFRGEALAAISSVSRMVLTTRQQGAPTGTRVVLTAGEIDDMGEIGCREGTTIEVRDLFYNTPARLKFLGTDRAEGQTCVQTALRSALGRPEISVRCLKDGVEQFFTPGDGKIESCVYALLGRELALDFLSVDSEGEGIACRGFVSAPEHCRGNRTAQYFFCNGRPIRSQKLSAALEQAYKNSAMVGKFPACVLYLSLNPNAVDVNVHPTKSEVRFADEKAAFDAVYYGALTALSREDKLTVPGYVPKSTAPAFARSDDMRQAPSGDKPVIARSEATRQSVSSSPKADFFQSMSASEFRARASGWEKPMRQESLWTPAPKGSYKPAETAVLHDSGGSYSAPLRPVEPRKIAVATIEQEEQSTLEPGFAEEPIRYIGECMKLYILLEQGDKLIVVDKHAAHERALFDKIRLWEQPLMAQELLLSVSVAVDAEALELWEANKEVFTHLGFEAEEFGENALLLRTVPADVDAAAAGALFEELLEKLREGRSLSLKDVRERLSETVACKAAIKSGYVSDPEELKALAGRVLSGELKYCPHGRPVAFVLTRQELDRRFERIQ